VPNSSPEFCNSTKLFSVVYCCCTNIHSLALTPKKIREFFTPIIELAKSLKKKAKAVKQLHNRDPVVTVSFIILTIM